MEAVEGAIDCAGVTAVWKQHGPATGVTREPLPLVLCGKAGERGINALPRYGAQDGEAGWSMADGGDRAADLWVHSHP